MDIINNQGEKIGSLTNAVSNDQSITINRIHDVTIVSTRYRNSGWSDQGVAAQPSLIHRRLAKTSHRIVPKLTDSSVGSDYDLVGGTKN